MVDALPGSMKDPFRDCEVGAEPSCNVIANKNFENYRKECIEKWNTACKLFRPRAPPPNKNSEEWKGSYKRCGILSALIFAKNCRASISPYILPHCRSMPRRLFRCFCHRRGFFSGVLLTSSACVLSNVLALLAAMPTVVGRVLAT